MSWQKEVMNAAVKARADKMTCDEQYKQCAKILYNIMCTENTIRTAVDPSKEFRISMYYTIELIKNHNIDIKPFRIDKDDYLCIGNDQLSRYTVENIIGEMHEDITRKAKRSSNIKAMNIIFVVVLIIFSLIYWVV